MRFEILTGEPPQRCVEIERLLAGAEAPVLVSDWRSDAQKLLFGPGAPVLEMGTAMAFKDRGHLSVAPAAQVFLVSALHARASMTSVGVPPNGILTLTAAEARLLADDFNRVFAVASPLVQPDAARLAAGNEGRLFCVFPSALRTQTIDPATAVGHDLWDFRPRGADAAVLARLSSETEMWLFDHALNRARRERGQLEINTLWPWGGGPVLDAMPPAPFNFEGADPLYSTWAESGAHSASLGSTIIVCNSAPGQEEFSQRMQTALSSAAKDLRRGSLAAVFLSAGRQCFAVRRMPGRLTFRRSKPWWDYFDDSD